MKKVKIVIALVIITLITSICLGLLYVIYNDNAGDIDFFRGTTNFKETKEGYDVINDEEGFNSYSINRGDMSNLELSINGASVSFKNEAIWINDTLITQGSELNRNFAVYDDCVLVLSFNYKYKVYGGIIVYNIYQNTYEIVEMINDMYVDITSYEQDIYFEKVGVTLDLKLVDGNYVLNGDKKKDICKYNKRPYIYVKKSIVYIYDTNDKKFDDFEEITAMEWEDYIVSNGLCGG